MADMILLVGNPNAGKSALFNRLTHGHARVGNWHGVTVDAAEGKAVCGKKAFTVVDLPGVYRAEGRSMEEKFALRYLSEHPQAALLFVSECAFAERTVALMRELTRDGRRCMLVLTKRKRFEREGGKIDREGLSRRLGIPVLYAEEEVARQLPALAESAPKTIGDFSAEGIFRPVAEGLTRVDRRLLNPFFGLPLFLFLLATAFFLTFQKGMPGDLMKEGITRLFTETLGGMAASIPSEPIRALVKDGLLGSLGGVLGFLPQIALLHLFLILLEESGLMSRLAVLTDGILSRIGLSGRAVFSLLMGFGCTAAAILTTRGLEDRRVQRRVILCLPYFSCSAKLPVYLVLAASFFENPFLAVSLLYLTGVCIALAVLLFLKGEGRPLIMELAPLQIPRPIFVAKSLLFQIKQFIIKVGTVILAFFLASWLLSSFDFTFTYCAVEESMLAVLCGGLSFLFAPAGMHDWRITYAALSGLIAKENVAGAITMFFGKFPFGARSAIAFSVFMLTCSPCVSALSACAREVGAPRALLYALVQNVSALLLCYLVYFLLSGGLFLLLPVAVLLAALLLIRNEMFHRRNRNHPQRIHRRHLRAGVDVLPHAAQRAGDPYQRRKDGAGLRPPSGR